MGSDPVDLTYARSRHRRLKSDEAKALREFSDPTSLLLALRSRNCWALANVVLNSSDSVASADANNLSLMAFSTESACSTEQ
jgi:hypothetical protein